MEDQEKEINIENTNINTNLEENEIPPDTVLSKKNIIEGETNLLIKEKEEAKEEEGIKNEENNEHENNKEEINLEKENVELKENINNQELNKEENVEQIVENKEGEIIEEKNEGQIMENNEEENGAPIAENDEEENAEQIMENNEENGEENNEEEIIKAEEIKEENEEQNIINEEEDKKEIQEIHKNEEIQENQELEEKNEIIPENEYIQENKDIKENEDIKENDEVVEEQENNQEEQEYEQNLEIQGNKEANIQLGEYKERQGMHIHKKEEKEEEYEERENDKEEEYNNNEENAEYLEENQNSPGQYIQNINYEQKIQYNIINQNLAEQENLKDLEEQIYQESDQIQTNSKEKERVKKYYKIKNGEPKDSIPRIHVQSSGKFTQEYETLIKERNYEIPKMRLFERIETEKAKKQKIKNESSSIKSGIKLKINDFKELIEIPKEDYGLYANKETIILDGGIETGEYKFIGEQSEWKQNTYPIEKVQITKEKTEINNDSGTKKAKKKKGKKGKKHKKDKSKEALLNNTEDKTFIVDKEDPKHWKTIISGPTDTPYENGKFEVSINFDEDKNIKPIINFLTKIYHYNIEQKDGKVLCPFIWNLSNDENDNLKNLEKILITPDYRYPCSKFIKDEYYNNYANYKEKAKNFTENYALN